MCDVVSLLGMTYIKIKVWSSSFLQLDTRFSYQKPLLLTNKQYITSWVDWVVPALIWFMFRVILSPLLKVIYCFPKVCNFSVRWKNSGFVTSAEKVNLRRVFYLWTGSETICCHQHQLNLYCSGKGASLKDWWERAFSFSSFGGWCNSSSTFAALGTWVRCLSTGRYSTYYKWSVLLSQDQSCAAGREERTVGENWWVYHGLFRECEHEQVTLGGWSSQPQAMEPGGLQSPCTPRQPVSSRATFR